jgi:hypothetical protein
MREQLFAERDEDIKRLISDADLRKRVLELTASTTGAALNFQGVKDIIAYQREQLVKERQLIQTQLAHAIAEGNTPFAEQLRTALLENQIALLQNTEELQTLTATMTDAQDFSSSSWLLFREAVFNGIGGLLPQFQIPQLQTGGMVTKTGLFQLHAGEAVVAHPEQSMAPVVLNINEAGKSPDPLYIGKRIAFEMKSRGR